ncbi:MAG TPA: amidohydrolase [Gammaproteobacteria bacterium]|jgi:N-acyl-D-aspartate/D-glutamate deacylase|nr:amidohydrolase [Gammaproteobacteria bacterium]
MQHDIVIRNGLVVDGTGAPGRIAHVAIDGDRITAVGADVGKGRREIAAEGRIVTPGFVDIHSHLDAQIAWDPVLTPSCWHGVTSVVIGNCGVTFAPCKPNDRQFLAEMMESVEDIPAHSIMNGLPWDWVTYGEYLGSLDRMPKGINVGGMVGHCAVRYYVMGDRSADQVDATPEEIASMCELVEEAIRAGALGFSTSRTRLHKVPDGRHVPGTWAATEEMLAIGHVLGRLGRGVFESAPRFEGDTEHYDKSRAEVAWMSELSRVTGRPVTFGISQADARPDLYRRVIEFAEAGNAQGGNVRPQTTVRGIGLLVGLSCGRTPWDNLPGWKSLRPLSLSEKLAALADPARRQALVAEADAASSWVALDKLYILDRADAAYYPRSENSLAGIAAARGQSPAAVFCELSLADGGATLFTHAFLNQRPEAVEEMIGNGTVVLGLADAGAHVGQIMDASQPTFFLRDWVRDRKLLSLEEAVRRLTSDTAQLFGLRDRGVLRAGAVADVNVIDLAGLRLPAPEYVRDFPGGAGRFVQRSAGYDCTLVNGQIFMERGEHTGAFAGRVLRTSD